MCVRKIRLDRFSQGRPAYAAQIVCSSRKLRRYAPAKWPHVHHRMTHHEVRTGAAASFADSVFTKERDAALQCLSSRLGNSLFPAPTAIKVFASGISTASLSLLDRQTSI